MNQIATLSHLRGPFHFLRLEPRELRSILPDGGGSLPVPQRIFLEREEATPLMGFPVQLNAASAELREALEGYLDAEEELQVAVLNKRVTDPKAYELAWGRYSRLLARATENAASSSFGRRYPSIFWLYHSIAVSRRFKEIPRRLLRRDPELARRRGDALKYEIFQRFLDKVLTVTYDAVHRVADESLDEENDLFPSLFERMRDNVLILTEDHVGPDLTELASYFRGYLEIDGRELTRRLALVAEWNERELASDTDLRAAVRHLIGDERDGRLLLNRCGYLSFVAERPSYDPDAMLSPAQVRIWEGLLQKLKEFELFLAVRRLIIPVRDEGGRLVCRAPRALGPGLVSRDVTLSETTRPLDFMAPWVVEPVVERFGLIYDITEFSSILSLLGRSGPTAQDTSYREIFRFQRWVNQQARSRRLKLEKYLGDGALYSGRHPSRLLALAVRLQRHYRQAVRDGFPFDRGLRIALNYGRYRLLPIEEGLHGEAQRYEFFGQGIVELTRLVTGKSMRDIEETKTMLVSRGYSVGDVDRFFAPVTAQNVDLLDRNEEKRAFHAYINPTGTLVNEGIVATEDFIREFERIEEVSPSYRVRDGDRVYVLLEIDEGNAPLLIGLRRLGKASFKGLGKLPILEVIDAERWRGAEVERLEPMNLLAALESAHRRARGAGPP